MNDHPIRVVEVVFNWPPEVFIQRHIDALASTGLSIVPVARHDDSLIKESASIPNTAIPGTIMPNFDRMNLREKIVSLRYLLLGQLFRGPGGRSLRGSVLKGFYKSLKPDLIHFQFGSLAEMMWQTPYELSIPYTLSLRGSDIQVNSLVSEVGKERLREAINHSSGIHTVSDSLWGKAQTFVDHDILHKTIYTTVPVDNSPGPIRHQEDCFHFITIGRLHWTKNFVDLLKAFRCLLNSGLNARLTIVGNGPDKERLIYWLNVLDLQGKVNLSGKLSYSEINELFKTAHAYIQSSITEGFSNALAEAMAAGLPVFATAVGGTAEIITDKQNGFLLDPFHCENWVTKLRLVSDRQLMENIGLAAWRTAQETFSSSVHAQEFYEFYKQIINRKDSTENVSQE